ncbi:hypothetical protein PoB_005324800 [Plakobranchus ocellatus]|uniref:Uncharacterized protein n=1 Tax=Plakobranchus ocellatus TaxID=259542 RepID=A0AAV4C6W0_9GAST|nr:hypothetical protein PoB_005324800 [Plakobranchus ocellatus]
MDGRGETMNGEARQYSVKKMYNVSSQQDDIRLSGPPPGQGAGVGARTRDRRVPADLRANSLATVPPTPHSTDTKARAAAAAAALSTSIGGSGGGGNLNLDQDRSDQSCRVAGRPSLRPVWRWQGSNPGQTGTRRSHYQGAETWNLGIRVSDRNQEKSLDTQTAMIWAR